MGNLKTCSEKRKIELARFGNVGCGRMNVKINQLKGYDLNEEYFNLLKGDDYAALKRDIEENGIKVDLHILKDNTVISGNQRLKIARELK